MATETGSKCECPSTDALRGLIRGGLPDPDQTVLTDHLGDCPGCQAKLEQIAADGDPRLSDAVRHVDKTVPPQQSAFWRALRDAEGAITRSSVQTPSSADTGELNLDFLQPTESPDRIGRLGRFDVNRVIGRGGMGVVLNALDQSLHREVAVKVLDPQLANNEVARQRFCREARAAASVTHDNLVAVHQVDIDERSGLPYIVMQLVNGETLEQRLKRVGRLSVAEAVRVGMQAAAGLTAAHASGLIHRDIKPANILLEAGTDKVKLTDFGLARAAEDLKLTRTGFVAGTPLYMAPEQARGDEVDARADLFSLGSVLYEALSGVPPFDAKTPLAVLRRIADEEHVAIEKLNPEVPDWLADLIDKLLAKDPSRRFQSAGELADLLTAKYACVQPPESLPEPCKLKLSASKIIGRRRRARALAAVMTGPFLLGTVLGGLGVWYFAPRTVEVGSEPTPQKTTGFLGSSVQAPTGPSPIATLKGTGGAVLSVATTADGKRVALGQENGQIPVFDLPDGRLVGIVGRHNGPVWAVDFSGDGKRLVAASDDGTVKVWDVETKKDVKTFPHPSSVRAAALSRNTNYLVTGSRDGRVFVYDMEGDGAPIREFNHGAVVNAVAIGPDGLTVASAGSDHRVIVWEIPPEPKGQMRLPPLTEHKGPVYSLSFSPEGGWLASAGWDQSVVLSDMKDGSVVRQVNTAHDDGITSVDFACCGKVIATAGQDGAIKLWDAEQGRELATLARQKGTVHVVRFTPDGNALVTGGRDGNAVVWPVNRPGHK